MQETGNHAQNGDHPKHQCCGHSLFGRITHYKQSTRSRQLRDAKAAGEKAQDIGSQHESYENDGA